MSAGTLILIPFGLGLAAAWIVPTRLSLALTWLGMALAYTVAVLTGAVIAPSEGERGFFVLYTATWFGITGVGFLIARAALGSGRSA